jgi:23S rRNA (guanosine2251-2'-O)-methyltransferase
VRQHKRFVQQHRPKKNLLIAGIDNVIAAMNDGVQVERIFLLSTLHSDAIEKLKNIAEEKGVPVNKVPSEKLKSFNINDHRGCIAVRSKIHYHPLQDVITFIVEKGESPLLMILDGITDIRNIGAIARSAWGCGAHALIIPEKGVGALNEDAITTSAGSLENIIVCRVKSIAQAIDELHLNGIRAFASEMTATKRIFDINFKEPCAIILGSEDKGIHPALYKICDEIFSIPMQNNFESLNVSVAAGMILYEAMKQRLAG